MSSKARTGEGSDPPKRKAPVRKQASRRRRPETLEEPIHESISAESTPSAFAEVTESPKPAENQFTPMPELPRKELTGLPKAAFAAPIPSLRPLEICALAIGIGILFGALLQRRLAFKSKSCRTRRTGVN